MIFNALFQLHTAVTNLLPVIPPSAMEYIDDALKQLARYHPASIYVCVSCVSCVSCVCVCAVTRHWHAGVASR
jgi:formate hydrogenlyase subunit 6/NADH:ubiquinone oxidoreductase subunit I